MKLFLALLSNRTHRRGFPSSAFRLHFEEDGAQRLSCEQWNREVSNVIKHYGK